MLPLGKQVFILFSAFILLSVKLALAQRLVPKTIDENKTVSSSAPIASFPKSNSTASHEGLLVEVEPSYISVTREGFSLPPYSLRRTDWGSSLNVGYSFFEPTDYQSSFSAEGFNAIYGSADTPLIELLWNPKRNWAFFSLGAELGVGFYKTESKENASLQSELTLIPLRIGGRLSLDNLFSEPFVAPYAFAGVYMIQFNEEQTNATTTFDGTTSFAPYFGVGVKAQLDWIDKNGAHQAYREAGIENTFLFAEIRQFLKSNDDKDPNFESDLHASLGLQLEF